MGSALNRQEWNTIAPRYASPVAGPGKPDTLCVPLLPKDLHGHRTLDAGCGTGWLTRWLARQGATVIGVDVSDGLIARAQEAEEAAPLGISYLVRDLMEPLPFEEGTFDIAISIWTMMDVEEPLAAIRNIGQTVRVGGQFVFSVVHPCFFRPRVNSEGTGPDLNTYFDRQRIEWRRIEARDGSDTQVKYRQFHRTLGDYLNTLAECGFCLLRLVEPEGTSELAISCRKVGAEEAT
ncbi:MAG: hypothetical protein CL878_13010 [Dehalococcoidia bacterium]|nr:hypothetical protein [Dehalococcoidia bacterium]